MPFIIVLILVVLVVIFAAFAPPSDISSFAWGYRIREFEFQNREKEYRVQQRIPVLYVWTTCTHLIGIDLYTYRSYKTYEEAKKFLDDFKKSVEESKGYRVKSKRAL